MKELKYISKKSALYSLIIGEASAWFLYLVIRNPYIEEFERLAEIPYLVWIMPVAFPLLFLLGILVADFLSRFVKIAYQAIRFIEVGVLNTAIDFGVLNLLIWSTGSIEGLAIVPLNVISFLAATINSYFWNKFWTFKTPAIISGEKKGISAEFAAFLVVSGIGIGINTGIVAAGTGLIPALFGLSAGAWANVMKICATIFSMTWNFIGYKFIVFKPKS